MTTHDAKRAMSAGGFRAETEMGSGGRCVLIVGQYMRNQCSAEQPGLQRNLWSGALKSLELVDSTARLREDNRICIWLEDV